MSLNRLLKGNSQVVQDGALLITIVLVASISVLEYVVAIVDTKVLKYGEGCTMDESVHPEHDVKLLTTHAGSCGLCIDT